MRGPTEARRGGEWQKSIPPKKGLAAKRLDAAPIKGCDSVLIVGLCDLGFELIFVLPLLVWPRRRRVRGRT